jgi:hypothetical protein
MVMRQRLFLALSLVAIALTGGYLMVSLTAPRISRATFARVELGMTRGQVEDILGPPGDYSTDESIADPVQGPATLVATEEELRREPPLPALGRWAEPFNNQSAKEWISDCGIIFVDFDGSGRVADKAFIAVRPISAGPTLLDKLRRFLGIG